MPKRAEETRKKKECARKQEQDARAEKMRIRDAALVELQTTRTQEWVLNTMAQFLFAIDDAADKGKIAIELELPRKNDKYFNALIAKYHKTDLLPYHIEVIIPTVHALIIADLREKYGYSVEGPFERTVTEWNGVALQTFHYKAIIVIW